MGKLDYKVLDILRENGRETASDTNKATHLSVSTVLGHIKRMEEPGIIEGYTVRVDAKVLGDGVTALMEISLKHPRFHGSFMEVITDHPNILDCYCLTGDYSFVLKIFCASSDELERTHRAIKSIPGVSATRTHFVLEKIKNMYSTIPEEEKK